MVNDHWKADDTEKALQHWAEYQRRNDMARHAGRVAGIEPATGRVWFGESGLDIRRQMESEGKAVPFYCIRVGRSYYVRKGGRR